MAAQSFRRFTDGVKHGEPVSVILPIKRYQEIIERLEDTPLPFGIAFTREACRGHLHHMMPQQRWTP